MFREILRLLSEGESFVLAVILSRSGSAPRVAGTRMIVRRDGSILGTIGGGVLEARTLQIAAQVFQTRKAAVQEFVLTAEDAARMGMICGGRVEILVHFLDVSQTDLLCLYRSVAAALEASERTWIITRIPSGKDDERPPAQCLVKGDGSIVGTLDLEDTLLKAHELIKHALHREPTCLTLQGERYLIEPLFPPFTVYIFGAGHVGQKLSILTAMAGFRTFVLDDREEFADAKRFKASVSVVVLDSYEHALKGLAVSPDSCIVIVTRGHAFDKTVLGQALKTEAGYIGMIGSRKKRDDTYEALAGEGFSREDFARVHCPIGLAIGAETPEEIAVSIVAELIQTKAEKNALRNLAAKPEKSP